MKKNFVFSLLSVVCTLSLLLMQPAFAGVLNPEPQDAAYPKTVPAPKWFNSWAYYLTKKIVVDIDKTITDIGLRPAVCGFKALDQKIYYYQQLGQCFFNAYLQYRQKTSEKIIIYSWLKDQSGKNVSQTPMKIIWNRPDQSLWTTVRQYVQLKLEGTWFESKTPVSMSFLAGSFSLYFPDEELFKTILKKSVIAQKLGPFADVTDIIRATHFELNNSGQRSEKNYMIYQGYLTVQFRSQDQVDIDLETDLNLAKMQRPFYVHGSTQWQAQGHNPPVRKP